MPNDYLVAGIGELLWDCFPDQRRLGGAPANFACIAKQLGLDAIPVSCVGADPLGVQARAEIEARTLDVDFVSACSANPTGTVEVVIDDGGKPSYRIRENVAWDHIPCSAELLSLAGKLDAACFGTLAQRSKKSRHTIRNVIAAMPGQALKVLDVNLRGDYYSQELLDESLTLANVLKLSDEELPRLAELLQLSGNTDQQLKQLLKRYGLRLVAYTMGSAGSKLMTSNETDVAAAVQVKTLDSVGAGDAFTATLVAGMLQGTSLKQCNELANQVAAFVCLQHGACPTLPEDLRRMVPTSPSE